MVVAKGEGKGEKGRLKWYRVPVWQHGRSSSDLSQQCEYLKHCCIVHLQLERMVSFKFFMTLIKKGKKDDQGSMR